ncbi:subtilisin-like protein [Basidiobolus meristosporus CBS 931.73]|uniref:Subtilisin-like protein n=1 Tax=Basidiobolus meristosporus CBS 931.73 TaxID=1314790 RepID=A0A1Y1YX66_9FUNG|nr:subtilisin-like protein [Basidiobolus meristosporus CBS 931.73]|eukprot:ORY02155.1 subtilisin-like protein [Basidiobolus meristosporus CBS 931.73]
MSRPDNDWPYAATGEVHTIGGRFHYVFGNYTKATLEYLRNHPLVDYIEKEAVIKASAYEKNPPSWGLDRIDQETFPLDQTYNYPDSGGEGVDVFVIDTGIYVEHQDFDGRAKWGTTVINSPNTDLNGHGTFTAAIIGGKTFGVAKKAALYAVKALNSEGEGSTLTLLKGLQYVSQMHQLKANKKTIVNLSLGTAYNRVINEAVNIAVEEGIVVVVAAGNGINGIDGQDACRFSPASASEVIAVGSTQINDAVSVFSNYGPCVTVYAPGDSVTSAFVGSTIATSTLSGTSFAAPHVSGVAALILGNATTSLTPREVKDRILAIATKNTIKNLPSDSPNFLLNNRIENYFANSENLVTTGAAGFVLSLVSGGYLLMT